MQTIPMLKRGDIKILGGGLNIFFFFLEDNLAAKQAFYPDEYREEIAESVVWFQ